MEKFNKYFKIAITEAVKAFDAGEIPVGCVIVDATGAVIARSHNRCEETGNPTMHAEMIAIAKAGRKVGKNLSGCVAYVSLAPCVMCATAFTYARISAVYYMAVDLKTGITESEKCKRLAEIDKNLYPTRFSFVQTDSCEKSQNLLKNFFAIVRAEQKMRKKSQKINN